MYSTVPAVVLVGLVRPALNPFIPPVIIPTVQVKLLAKVAVKKIFVLVPLQIMAMLGVMTTGDGGWELTVTRLPADIQPSEFMALTV